MISHETLNLRCPYSRYSELFVSLFLTQLKDLESLFALMKTNDNEEVFNLKVMFRLDFQSYDYCMNGMVQAAVVAQAVEQ